MKVINIINTIAIILAVWFALSVCDVVANNLDREPQYKNWNMITMICDLAE